MGIEHEDAVRGFLLAFEGETLDSAQIERIVSRMAPDARYQIFAWKGPIVGHDAIRDELLRHAAMTSDGRCEFVNIASAGQIVFVERVDFTTIDGKRAGFHVVGVFEVDADGKIASWRDYLDSREIAALLGADGAGTT